MTYSKINIISRLQRWMDSENGQTFLNYAYSWGASIVILGTLFKLTHLPGADFFLFLGMGTEVCVFFLAAFDRPFEKVSDSQQTAAATASQDAMPATVMPTKEMTERMDAACEALVDATENCTERMKTTSALLDGVQTKATGLMRFLTAIQDSVKKEINKSL